MLILVKHRNRLSPYPNALERVFFTAFENHFKSLHFNPEEKVSIKIDVNRDLEALKLLNELSEQSENCTSTTFDKNLNYASLKNFFLPSIFHTETCN